MESLLESGARLVILLVIELCYNWPKADVCRHHANPTPESPMPRQCENPATPASSLLLQVLHLGVLWGCLLGGGPKGGTG